MASMDISSHVNVKECSQCQWDTEYYCMTCDLNLCPPCKRTHTIKLDTKDHDVTTYREKLNSVYISEMCAKHPDQVYEIYCKTCDVPVCFHCTEHGRHQLQNLRIVYEDKRKENEKIAINIRSEKLYDAERLRCELQTDVIAVKNETIPNLLKAMLTKSIKLNYCFDNLLNKIFHNIKVEFNYIFCYILRKQRQKMIRYVSMIRDFERLYEQSAYKPVQFLHIKKSSLPQIQDTPDLTQHCLLLLTKGINIKDLGKVLSEIKITAKGKRHARNELLLTMMPSTVFQKFLKVKDVKCTCHISCVTKDRVWTGDYDNNIILTNTATGDILYSVQNALRSFSGIHTVNHEGELLYVDEDYNVKKITKDMENINFIRTESEWLPRCLYCSPDTGEVMVGMYAFITYEEKVVLGTNTTSTEKVVFDKRKKTVTSGQIVRHSKTGQRIQTLVQGKPTNTLYKDPIYITENSNGDVVVSDLFRGRGAVVVTSRKGKHRFSYTGLPLRLRLSPRGICTDALSHILVCDINTDSIHMLDRDGQFLAYLLIQHQPGIYKPSGLSYDFTTHRLWVGSGNNSIVSVYRYIERHTGLTGKTNCTHITT